MEKYSFRISVDPNYVAALGRAIYHFAYLEKNVSDVIRKIDPDSFVFAESKQKPTSGKYADALQNCTKKCPKNMQVEIDTFVTEFRKMALLRNQLLHAHPYSETNGEQKVAHPDNNSFTEQYIYEVALKFEDAAIKANEILYSI